VVQVSSEESREHEEPQQVEEPKNIPQEDREVVDVPEEEEDLEEVEVYKDSEDEKKVEEHEAQEENSKEPEINKLKKDKDPVYYRAEEYCSYGEGGNMTHNLCELLDRIDIATQPMHSIKKVFCPEREERIGITTKLMYSINMPHNLRELMTSIPPTTPNPNSGMALPPSTGITAMPSPPRSATVLCATTTALLSPSPPQSKCLAWYPIS
jgi:hypothetical protein